ncbi:hypothetical protein BS47DRAFT_1397102 [Hydnum rufescens UP504]|uniref:tRNA uridine 5-carboxymethylaminomethyl modification enzyme C-terminal subdomain domain-containing protein n=1 Tax=Hydnum rufescens UP504 TaxID=1448309 RepID=A0A9P6AQR8_9AGAM|nr:hypothetical protein BS47DRAFT_1397102 [Hydnum rufescens UP504]
MRGMQTLPSRLRLLRVQRPLSIRVRHRALATIASSETLQESSERTQYDVCVIGGGHAGCEAAAAAARTGARTLLLTQNLDTIGEMSCNPSFGGVGKGTLVREVDALDGVCGRVADKAGIMFHVLNRSKGAAVWGLRAQIDRKLYKKYMQETLLNYPNLDVRAASVHDLIWSDQNPVASSSRVSTPDQPAVWAQVAGVRLGKEFFSCANVGLTVYPAGRINEAASTGLSSSLKKAGFSISRLKTGTPPRLAKASINWSGLTGAVGGYRCQAVLGTELFTSLGVRHRTIRFRASEHELHQKLMPLFDENLHLSVHIRETVRGPRYCPSIESKVIRFHEKDGHTVWLEPEGYDSDVIYPNGISCTLPPEAQERMLRTIPGLENMLASSEVGDPFFPDCTLFELIGINSATLETKRIPGLFLAGQINGEEHSTSWTSGLLTILLSGLSALSRPPLVLTRADAFLGVMVDDLISRGAEEPCVFLSLPAWDFEDSCESFRRLPKDRRLAGIVSDERWAAFGRTRDQLQRGWAAAGFKVSSDGIQRSAFDLLGHPNISTSAFIPVIPQLAHMERILLERVDVEGQYRFYLKRQAHDVRAFMQDEEILLPPEVDYASIRGLSYEVRERLERVRPASIGAAKRMEGMTPASLLHLIGHAKSHSARSRHQKEIA